MALYRTLAPVNILRLHFLSVSVSQLGIPVGWAKRPDQLTGWQMFGAKELEEIGLIPSCWIWRSTGGTVVHAGKRFLHQLHGSKSYSRIQVVGYLKVRIWDNWVEEREIWDCSYELDKGFRESTMLIVKCWSQSIERATPLGTLQAIMYQANIPGDTNKGVSFKTGRGQHYKP